MSANANNTIDVPMNLEQIQGNVIGFNKPFQTFLFLNFNSSDGARGWLASIAPKITNADKVLDTRKNFREQRRQARRQRDEAGEPGAQVLPAPPQREPSTEVWYNVAFTYAGLEVLQSAPLDGFPPEFKGGMASRADILGDWGDNAPDKWRFGKVQVVDGVTRVDTPVHALLILASDDDGKLGTEVGDRRAELGGFQIKALHVEEGKPINGTPGTEHFGFRDDVSQPGIRNDAVNPPDLLQQGQVRICPGEFVLGYPRHDPDEEPGTETKLGAEAEPSPIWTENGSYVVVRRLKQHVASFNRSVTEGATKHGITEELFKAKLVGRYPSGAPLAALKQHVANANQGPPGAGADPGQPGSPLLDDQNINNFDYRGDSDGNLVPLGAHIRRLHPRDQVAGNRSFIETKRILRRGIPYARAEDDRGLIFVCYQRSIKEQYEFLQQSWANDPHFPAPGQRSAWPGRDPLIGSGRGEDHRARKFHIPNNKNVDHASLARWITMTGGDYFFSPSLQALGDLVTGRLLDVTERRRDEAVRGQVVAERTRDIAERRHHDAQRMVEEAGDDLAVAQEATAAVERGDHVRGGMHGQQAAERRKADVERRWEEAKRAVKETEDALGAAERRLGSATDELGAAEREWRKS